MLLIYPHIIKRRLNLGIFNSNSLHRHTNGCFTLNYFWKSSPSFQQETLIFKSFSKSGLKNISDKWDYQNKTFLDNMTIHNKLQKKRNCISKWSKIKTSVPKKLVEKIKTLDTCTNKRKVKLYIDNNLLFVTVRIKLFSIEMLDYKLLKKNC
jgi:hypothetical protein